MAKQEYSDYQKKIISNYYNNLDKISLDRLQKLVTDLYLADSEAKKEKLWERVAKALEKLDVPAEIRGHILDSKDIEVLAKNIQEWNRV